MPLFSQVSCMCLWSWEGPWNVLWSCVISRGVLWSYCGSSVVFSLNTFSISISRCSPRHLLFVFSSCKLLEKGSDPWVSDGPSIGSGRSPPHPHSLILHGMVALNSHPLCWMTHYKMKICVSINIPEISEGNIAFSESKLIKIYS